jgi:tetratricopeptide (TPR) repeat protein
MASEASGARSNAVADALGALADLRRVLGRFDEAMDMSRKTTDIVEECHGEDHPQLAYHLLRQGMIGVQYGDHAAAARDLDRAIELALQRNRRANSLLGVLQLIRGILELERERFDAATEALLEARRISESVYGRGHRMTMDSIMVLAEVRLEQDKLVESAQLVEEAMSICDRQDKVFPIDRIDLLNVASRVRMARGESSAAEQFQAEAARLVEEHLSHEHYVHAEVLRNRAGLRRRQGRRDEAVEDLRNALRIQERVRLPEHPVIARLLEDLSEVLAEKGNDAEAADARSRADSIRAAIAENG